MKLYPTTNKLGDNDYVIVEPGGESEKNWRGHGYVSEGELMVTKKTSRRKETVADDEGAQDTSASVELPESVALPALEDLTMEELRARWEATHHEAPHPRLGRDRLIAEIRETEGE